MNHLVSVVVTTFNQAAYIADALKSVWAQTFQDYEIIVVDDGSTDGTFDRLAAFKDRFLYVYQRNQGVAASRNVGVRNARGQLLAFLDGDDLWEPEKLAEQVSAARSYTDAGLIVADGVQFSGDQVLSPTLLGTALDPLFSSSREIVAARCYEKMLSGNPIYTTSQVMIPARVLDKVGLSNRSFRLASDYDLYLRIAAHYPVVFVKEPLVRWRYVATSASGPHELRSLRWDEDILAVQRSHLPRTPSRQTLKAFMEARIVSSCAEAYYYGHYAKRLWATKYLLRLFARNPSAYRAVIYLLGLWCPGWLSRIVAPVARKLLLRTVLLCFVIAEY